MAHASTLKVIDRVDLTLSREEAITLSALLYSGVEMSGVPSVVMHLREIGKALRGSMGEAYTFDYRPATGIESLFKTANITGTRKA